MRRLGVKLMSVIFLFIGLFIHYKEVELFFDFHLIQNVEVAVDNLDISYLLLNENYFVLLPYGIAKYMNRTPS